MNTTFGDGSRKLRLYWLSARRQLLASLSPWATPTQAPSASPFARSRVKRPWSFAEISRDHATGRRRRDLVPKRIDAGGQAEPIESRGHLVPSFAQSSDIG